MHVTISQKQALRILLEMKRKLWMEIRSRTGERNANGAALAGHGLVTGQQLLLVGVQIQAVVLALTSHGLIAAVAGDELAAIGKGVDGELTVVAAAAALDTDHLLVKGFQLGQIHHPGSFLSKL